MLTTFLCTSPQADKFKTVIQFSGWFDMQPLTFHFAYLSDKAD